MKLKKALLMSLCMVLVAVVAIGGTLAYLTDRDSKVNVFTVGNVKIELNESFQQGAKLIPGVNIEKIPTITNKGDNNAYVWLTFSIPSALDNLVQGTETGSNENVIHWNPLGATTENYVTEERVNNAIAAGYIDSSLTAEKILQNKMTWNVFNSIAQGKNAYKETIDGVEYNTYVLLYNKALEKDETTLPSIYKVFLDAQVDIDPDGNWYKVNNGVATKLEWNSNTNGAPVIYASAYGIQADGFATVNDAYAAYKNQWGDNGSEYAPVPKLIEVKTSNELADAITNANGPTIINLANGQYNTNVKIPAGSNITIIGSKDAVISGQIATTTSTAGTLTINGVTVRVDSSIKDSTGISQTSKSAIAIWGNQTVICENVTFDMSLADSTAITSWWDTGVGTSIVVRNCVFNCNGQRPIRATGNVTVENTTFNDPYRYAVQLTAKASTADLLDKAIINFNNNTIVNGENGKSFVYGIQLEGADYGCHDCLINGVGNKIENGGTESTMYYCECGKVDHNTIKWNTEVNPVHDKN